MIHELRDSDQAEAIEILIGLVGDEVEELVAPRTSIADEALEALCSLTKRDFGKNESKCREWWNSVGKKEYELAPLK